MEKILIASGIERDGSVLAQMLKAEGYHDLTVVTSAADARRKMVHCQYYIVILNMPLSDEMGLELADQFAKTDAAVLAIVKGGCEGVFNKKQKRNGIYILTRPLSKQGFGDVLSYIDSTQYRVLTLKKKNKELLKSVEDLKVIQRGKCILMERKHLSEEEAHHYMEQEAMALRLSKRQLAEKVLSEE